MRLWVIAYDIADDKRRRTLVKTLARQLQRVQESVFEGWLTQREMNRLTEEISAIIDLAEDRLRAYPLAVRKEERYRALGQHTRSTPHDDYWIIG